MAAKRKHRVAPHARAKVAARDLAALGPDAAWASDIIDRVTADNHPWQLDAVNDPSLYISLLVGRGGGKTTALRVRALIKMLTIHRARILYVATSRPVATDLNWEPLKQLVDELGVREDFVFHETKMHCICRRTGSTYEFTGAENKKEVDKLRGQPFNEVQIDECASHDPGLLETLLDRAVGPRLGERNGVIILAGTPGHVLRGLFYDATRDGVGDDILHRPYAQRDQPEHAGWLGYSSHAWSMTDIIALPNHMERYPSLVKNWQRALLDKQRKLWTDDNPIWRREYLGKWAADNTTSMYAYRPHLEDGSPYNRWTPYGARKLEGVLAIKAAIAGLPSDVPDWLYGYGLDLGSRDPFALTVLAFSPSDPLRRFFHVFSFDRRQMYSNAIAELLIGPEATKIAMRGEVYSELGGLFGVTGWPVAIVADLAGLGEAILLELEKIYGIRIKAAEKKGKFGAIEVTNGDLVDGRMFILGDSPLEAQLQALQWKPDEYGQPKEDKVARNDHADSLTYIRTELGAMFAAAAPAAPGKPNVQRSYARPSRLRADLEGPSRSKTGGGDGEFDGLLSNNDFSSLR